MLVYLKQLQLTRSESWKSLTEFMINKKPGFYLQRFWCQNSSLMILMCSPRWDFPQKKTLKKYFKISIVKVVSVNSHTTLVHHLVPITKEWVKRKLEGLAFPNPAGLRSSLHCPSLNSKRNQVNFSNVGALGLVPTVWNCAPLSLSFYVK